MSKFLDETGLAYFWNKIKAALSTVAFTGSYNDLSNKPNIPASSIVDTALSSTSKNPVQNKVINTALGTKANDSDVVHISGTETVSGTKTFIENPYITKAGPIFYLNRIYEESAPTDIVDIRFQNNGTNEAVIRLTLTQDLQLGAKGDGANWYNGPALILKKDNTFLLRSGYGGTTYALVGSADGNLTWRSKVIALDENVVHKTGDEIITGQKTINTLVVTGAGNLRKTDDTHDLWLCSGINNTTAHGAYVGLYGAANSGNYPGYFLIVTGTVNNQHGSLIGKPDGTLTWNGKNIATTDSNITGTAANVTGTVAIANGGTGRTSFANSNGVITVNNTNNQFTAVATASGALYATSANGVSQFGTLPIAQGGTGATTRLNAFKNLTNENVATDAAHFVTFSSSWAKAGYTSVANVKTVLGLGSAAYTASTDYATSSHTHDYLPLSGGNLTGSIKLNTTSTVGIYKGNATSLAEFSGGSALNKGARLGLYGESHTSNAGRFDLIAGNASTSKSLIGKPDGTLTWGGQSVSTSSDERIKTKLQQIPEDILDAWGDVEWGEFKFLEAVADKGENARLHTGLIAQAVDRAFKAKNLDACKYGILCHEERKATEEEPAVDLWTVRYTEALCMEAAYQRRRAEKAEARITTLEEEIAKIKSLLEVK